MSLEGQGDSLIVSMSIFLKIFDLFDSMFVLNAISNFKANISLKKGRFEWGLEADLLKHHEKDIFIFNF